MLAMVVAAIGVGVGVGALLMITNGDITFVLGDNAKNTYTRRP